MQRRDFIQALVALGLAPRLVAQQAANPAPPPAAPVPWTLGLTPSTELPQTQAADTIAAADTVFFSGEQMDALTHLCDILVPTIGSKPGALQAETPAFLDFLIGNSPAARKQLYTGGLDWLNSEAQTRYGAPFAKMNANQADALIRPWLRTWMTDHPPTEPYAGFISIAHADIRTATMNSKVWIARLGQENQDWVTSGLYWSPIEPDVYAENFQSVHLRPSPTPDSSASTHLTPSYPH
jgi:hypothetical protein